MPTRGPGYIPGTPLAHPLLVALPLQGMCQGCFAYLGVRHNVGRLAKALYFPWATTRTMQWPTLF
jgi:hypothetical protein